MPVIWGLIGLIMLVVCSKPEDEREVRIADEGVETVSSDLVCRLEAPELPPIPGWLDALGELVSLELSKLVEPVTCAADIEASFE